VQSTTQETLTKETQFAQMPAFRRKLRDAFHPLRGGEAAGGVGKDRTPSGLSVFKDSSTVADGVRVSRG
jgi:hypothetical protein